MFWRAVLVAVALMVAGTVRAAEPLAQLPGLVRETTTVPFAPHGGAPVQLEALVTRPAAAGRYPLIVLSHGAPRDAADRAKTGTGYGSAVAIAFARRGWAVLSVVRRGYGHSPGPYVESSGSCDHRDYVAAGRHSAEDIGAAVKFMARQPYVDPARVMLAGHSAGGFASIAAASEKIPGLVAVLNFAGGRGSDAPDSVCAPDRLVAAFGEFGRTVRVPTLWFYAQNDHYMPAKLSQRFYDSFTKSGGTGVFVKLPAFGDDGHQLFNAEGMTLWRDRVDAFLREQKLPTWPKPVVEASPRLAPPSGFSAKGREAFERYLALTGFEKAFAISPSHHYNYVTGKRDPAEAAHAAVEECAKQASGCRVYAVNNTLAR